MRRPLFRLIATCGVAALTAGAAGAQFPAPFGPGPNAQQQPAQNPGVEVLARGPVHEAFAATAEFPTPGAVVPKLPPDPVEELPPDQRPAGDNVQWINGYWQFDDERADFVWVSGFWRVPPPGRVWFPGSWRPVQGGAQWVSGFWQAPAAQANQAEMQYLPPPPQPLEYGPGAPAPDPSSIYVPGCWVYRERYVWRPGFYMDYRPGWIWVPAHYRWTPGGYVFIDGYWDYPLDTRGVLFAPVALPPAIYNGGGFVYTPNYAVSQQSMVSALFVRRGFGSYFFGDYFEARYAQAGFNPWIGRPTGGFALNININRGFVAPDPLYSYYRAAYRQNPVWNSQIHDVYAGRYRGDIQRPPHTLVQQQTVINNITNVNNTVINNRVNNVVVNNQVNNTLAMVQPLSAIGRNDPALNLQQVDRAGRLREQGLAREAREVGVQRQRVETSLADRRIAPQALNDRPREATIAVPRQMMARAITPPSANVPPQPVRTNRPAALTGQPIPGTPVAPATVQAPQPTVPQQPNPRFNGATIPPANVAQPQPSQQMNPRPARPHGTIPPATVMPQPPHPQPTMPTPAVTQQPLRVQPTTIPPATVTPRPTQVQPRPQPTIPPAQVQPQRPQPQPTMPPAQVQPQRPPMPPPPRLGNPPPMPRPQPTPIPPARTSVPPPAMPSRPAVPQTQPAPAPTQPRPTVNPPQRSGRPITPPKKD